MNTLNEGGTRSRATSISRASRQGSTVSRSQSLIRKNVASHDLKPSDILIERFVAWKAIVKQLIAYFEGVADIENNTSREMVKLGAVIQVPFRAGNQFLGDGGLQDVFYEIRDKTRSIADQHANLGRTIDSSIVQHLQKLRTEIKAHIKNIQNDTGKLATNVAKERELSSKLISELTSSISSYKNSPMQVTAKSDPYVSNQAVARQLGKQVHEENLLQKSIIIMQQNSAHFEEGIVRSIQSAWQTFDEWQSRMSSSVQETWRSLSTHMSSLAPDREWLSFSARSDHLLDPETPLRNPDAINYPSKEDPSVIPVHSGMLERKKRFTRAYRESYFVLTPSGFLHEYSTSDTSIGATPIFSLFLPVCTLGPPSSQSAKSHKFHIEGRKDGTGSTKKGSLRASFGRGGHAWSFRSRSREDMMEWWNDIRMLCARYLVASESMDRDGPIAAAVRSAGYASEDEEGDYDEDEGSSVEEEEEEDEVDEVYNVPPEDAHPPNYSHVEKPQGQAVGPNGYPIDKKPNPDNAGYNNPNSNPNPPHDHQPYPAQDGMGHVPGALDMDEPRGTQLQDNGPVPSQDIARKPSKRQQEKAPEGREPQVPPPAEEAVKGESKFTENLD